MYSLENYQEKDQQVIEVSKQLKYFDVFYKITIHNVCLEANEKDCWYKAKDGKVYKLSFIKYFENKYFLYSNSLVNLWDIPDYPINSKEVSAFHSDGILNKQLESIELGSMELKMNVISSEEGSMFLFAISHSFH